MNDVNLTDLYVANVFMATSYDGEDGFMTFEVCGKFIELSHTIPHPRGGYYDTKRTFLKISYYRSRSISRHGLHIQKPPMQTICLNSSDKYSNDAIALVNFFANDDVVEWSDD